MVAERKAAIRNAEKVMVGVCGAHDVLDVYITKKEAMYLLGRDPDGTQFHFGRDDDNHAGHLYISSHNGGAPFDDELGA